MDKRVFDNIGETLWEETLENGLRVQVLSRPGFGKSFALFAVDYGGADRRFFIDGAWRDTPAGVAHFLEHKMFDTPDGGNALSQLSAQGARPNAFTGAGMTAYHFSCTEHFYDNLRTLLSFVSVPYFTQESVDKEQGIIGQEICMINDSPSHVLYYGLLASLYAHHPIRESVAGSVESIAQITADTLYDCHRVFYRPSNMTLVCVGDLDAGRIADIAREILPGERGEKPGRDYGTAETLVPASTRFQRRMTVSAPQFLLGAKLTPAERGSALLRQQLTGELALSFLVGESSPFYNHLYNEGLLNRSFGWELYYAAGTASVVLGGESRDSARVAAELERRLHSVAENGLDAARFERCRKALYGDHLRALAGFEGVASSLAEGYFAGYTPLDACTELTALTAEDCAAFLTQTLAPERLALSQLDPLENN